MPRREIVAYSVFGLILAATWWHPIYPADQALHNSLTAVAIVALFALRKRLPFKSIVLVLVFLSLHSIAARWLYSYVPYDSWTKTLFGFSLNEKLGWSRDNFDRLVHITYGLCLGPILFWHFADRLGWKARWAAFAAVDIVLSTSAFYELFEWVIAMTMSPANAEAYNGQQGDMWDAHKDMTCAFVASIVAVSLICLVRRIRRDRSLGRFPAGEMAESAVGGRDDQV